ncbi:hypothetical protein MCOR32_001402 [Pyricularia oryzae]|uniref:Zn(2)-C6 fungal-type domain-containing protein n=1 Tax=Pyricularia grisea TaxID=148305 RepID=A0ABQ8NLK3_PYRGI|nr:hypothetical protein MCOR01_011670 [Pyricularia oryzae]KAI6298906.1 hypothetical protein MCOR33_005093 [Pyricularia grisea]KAI6385438.1 hypothetical protein MCOR32_001402 [Pyricularia oryzae]KAI6414892.1 hypothetical protein MCOR20_001905 [Pyricularia oryzae]KAI6600478.1 hypothetical protein MCOR12_004624 [Pyricularia oryzae]
MVGRKKACDSCHRRKIQCHGSLPQCNWCKQRGLPCTFNRETSIRRKSSRPAQAATSRGSQNDLARRMDRIEQILQAAQRNQADPSSGLPRHDTVLEEAAALAADLLADGSSAIPSPAMSSPGRNRSGEAQSQSWPAVKLEEGVPPGPMVDHVETAQQHTYPSPFSSIPSYAPPGFGYLPQATAMPSGAGFGKLYVAGMDLGELSPYNGVPYFSDAGLDWIRERCDTEPQFDSIFARLRAPSGPRTASTPASNPARDSADPEDQSTNGQCTTGQCYDDGILWQTRPDGWFLEQGHLNVGDMPAVLKRQPAADLPDRALLEYCVLLFRQSFLGVTTPVVDPVLFAATIERAYSYYQPTTDDRQPRETSGSPSQDASRSPMDKSDEAEAGNDHAWEYRRKRRLGDEYRSRRGMEALCAKACIFAFMALVSLIETDKDAGLPAIEGDAYAAATHLMFAEFIPAASVVTVETVTMLTIFHTLTGQLQAAGMFHTSAVRVLFMLGGHTAYGSGFSPEDDPLAPPNMNGIHISVSPEKEDHVDEKPPPETPDARLRRHMRNLYRISYLLDKELELRTGLPPCMDNDYCDLAILERSWSVDADGLPLDKHMSTGNTGFSKYNLTLREEIAFKEKLDPAQLRISMIKSRVSKLLYSVVSLRKSDAQLLRDIRELDEELDRWRSSLPPQHRPMLVVPTRTKNRSRGSTAPGTSPSGARADSMMSQGASPIKPFPHGPTSEYEHHHHHHHHQQHQTSTGHSVTPEATSNGSSNPWTPMNGDQSSRHDSARTNEEDDSDSSDSDDIRSKDRNRWYSNDLIMHFEYHYLMGTIHRASGRCRAWTQGGEMAGISSSQALALQASRSTLMYLRTDVMSRHGMAFWMLFFYPMSAILTIFCNVLLNPLDASAEEDLELLGSVENLIKEMRRRRHLSPNEMVNITMIDEFVAELTRLGNCAIHNASREANGPDGGSVAHENQQQLLQQQQHHHHHQQQHQQHHPIRRASFNIVGR